jgi:hypothetical protein
MTADKSLGWILAWPLVVYAFILGLLQGVSSLS